MSIKFYTDSHIAKAVTRQLNRRGVDIVRCQDVGMENADDREHLEYAVSRGRTIITGDADFLALDALWRDADRSHTGIIYIKPENREAIGAIVKALHFLHEAVEGGAADLEKDVYNQVMRI
jgi:predicted nuclease of predicted toxin-antitoxin system